MINAHLHSNGIDEPPIIKSSTSSLTVRHGLQQLLHLSLNGLQAPTQLTRLSSSRSSLCCGGGLPRLQLSNLLLLCCQLLPHAVEDQGLTLVKLPTVLQQLQPHWGAALPFQTAHLHWKWMQEVGYGSNPSLGMTRSLGSTDCAPTQLM